jgi:hypothetical protein
LILPIRSKPCAKAGTRQEIFEIVRVRAVIEETQGSSSSGKNCPTGKFFSLNSFNRERREKVKPIRQIDGKSGYRLFRVVRVF